MHRRQAALSLLLLSAWLMLPISDARAQQPSPDPSQLTADELLNHARQAYDAGNWPQAEALFQAFLDTYGATPETAGAVARLKPLLVSSKLRQKKYAETIDLLEDVLQDPQLDPTAADELAFWRGICHLQTEAHDAALAAFAAFHDRQLPYVAKLPPAHRAIHNGRRTESVLLHGICLVLKEDHTGAAAFLGQQIPALRHFNRETAGRATVLRLHALLAADDDAAALQVVKETYPRIGEISQIIAFQTLCLQLGSKLLENGQFYDAIACLQRIWPKQRLLKHQQQSLGQFQTRLEQIRKNPSQEYLSFQYEGLITRIQREIENFEKIPSFDSALRFRVATAYQGLQRYREAAIILEDMLHRMPPDDLVKSASLNLIQCWLQTERWPQAVAAADAYLEKFNQPDNTDVPTVRFLRATALHSDRRPYDAELAFTTIHKTYPDHELAPRALFMEGICLLEQDLNLEAIDAFRETAAGYPDSDIVEDTVYWTGMALSFDKQHEAAREQMRTYLARYKDRARYIPDATFRIAHATFSLADYPQSINLLRDFITRYQGSQHAEEAKLLLGDGLGAEGRIDEAIAAYLTLDKHANPKFHEDAQFRIGNIHKLAERFDAMRAHFQAFLDGNAKSHRIGEAVYWIGWTYDRTGDRDQARQIYWDILEKYGNNPSISGVDDILTALPKLHPGDDGRDLLSSRLDQLITQHPDAALSLRATWAKAHLWRKVDPDHANTWLSSLAPKIDPKVHSPRLMADVADALRETNDLAGARRLYTELRKWHPRALEKDRAFFGLGLIALAENRKDDALRNFERFEKETLGSSLLGEVFQIKAGLYAEAKEFSRAQAEYEKILELPAVSRHLKARTLLSLGELLVRQKEDLKATAYFERVYLSYGKYPTQVAAAYWQRAQALDRLGQPAKALEVYRELALHHGLTARPEQREAEQLLNKRDPEWRFRSVSPGAGAPMPTSPLPSP